MCMYIGIQYPKRIKYKQVIFHLTELPKIYSIFKLLVLCQLKSSHKSYALLTSQFVYCLADTVLLITEQAMKPPMLIANLTFPSDLQLIQTSFTATVALLDCLNLPSTVLNPQPSERVIFNA